MPPDRHVHVTGAIRQHGSEERVLLIRYEVSGGSVRDFAGPFVQRVVGDPASWRKFQIDADIPSELTTGTCRIFAADAAAVQPDVAEDSRAF